jgi:Protein of unknown function (DUF3175)
MAKAAKKTRKSAKRSTAKKTHARPNRTRKSARTPARGGRRWSKHVNETSDALDLKGGVFKLRDPKQIAASLKRSAEHSKRRKADPYRSAMSMLTFYINRAGRTLSATRRRTLERAKAKLREQFGRTAH